MFNKIRSIIGNQILRKQLVNNRRMRKLVNLKDAKNIGIVYLLEDVPDYNRIESFVAGLQHDHKEVKAMGFVRNKVLINRFLPKLSYDFFSPGDMNWFFQPVSAKVKDFMAKDFDIIIDMSISGNLPLRYITALSSSHCRIGRFSEENKDCYDLMLNVDDKTSLDDYMTQVTHYLTIINSDASKN